MIKTLIKLALVALVIHACWRSGNVFLRHYKFKDAVHETALFSATKSDAQVQARVLELAQQLDLPVQPENITIRHEENRIVINAVYTDQIELIPTKFYPWEFKVDVDAFNANLPSSNDIAAPGR
jgi:hypothetical protein